MTNHQLAALLLAQPELPVYLRSTDPTDWTYNIPITPDDISVDEEFYPEEGDPNVNKPFGEEDEDSSIIISVITIDI